MVEITVNNIAEFEELTQARDFRIAEALYEAIIKNLNTKKRSIHFLTVSILETQEIIDLTVERNMFADTLEEILPHYINHEKYEECAIIKKTIEQLKNK